jgi:hypothetical protein
MDSFEPQTASGLFVAISAALYAAAGVGVLPDNPFGDELRQPLQGPHIGGHADVDLLNAEEGIGGRVAAVGGRDHVDAAADAPALDGHEHRHAGPLERGERILELLGRQPQLRPLAPDLARPVGAPAEEARIATEDAEVHAGGEVTTGRRHHEGAGRAFVAHGVDDLGELLPELGHHRVQLVRSIQSDVTDVVDDLDIKAPVGHHSLLAEAVTKR